MTKAMFAGVAATLALVLFLGANQAGEKQAKEPKYKISEVMQKAMKGGLAKKVADGKATKEEKQQLIEMFVSLHDQAPPRGERDAWDKVTQALVDTAQEIDKGDAAAGKKLAKLINCANCHKEFKGK